MHSPRISWLVAVLSLVTLVVVTACEPEEDPAGPDQARQQTVSPGVEGPAGLVGDSHFLEISEELPSFAGFYYNDSGQLVVALTDPSDFDAAVQVILPYFGHYPPENGLVVEEVAYSFRELAEHRTRLRQHVFRLGPVVSLGVKESTNRVTVGIDDMGAEQRVRGLLSSLGIPEEVTSIHRDFPIKRTSHELDSIHPDTVVEGGWRIQRGDTLCTLGFPVLQSDSTPGWVTNSHCTEDPYAPDGADAGQPVPFNHIGSEIDDPHTFSCSAGDKCRHADVALFSAAVPIRLGTIARTTYSSGTEGDSGSLIIDHITPTIPITGRRNYNIENETLHKIGRTTGWTYGAVEDTCSDRKPEDVYKLCSDRVDYHSDGGDSGSPVFRYFSGGHAELRGIHWGRSGCPVGVGYCDAWMSDLEQIEKDLGQLIVYDSKPDAEIWGPDKVPENVTTCEWTANVTGGTTPYSYQWKRDGVLVGTSSTYSGDTGTSDFQLELTVTDSESETDSDTQSVDVHIDAEDCMA